MSSPISVLCASPSSGSPADGRTDNDTQVMSRLRRMISKSNLCVVVSVLSIIAVLYNIWVLERFAASPAYRGKPDPPNPPFTEKITCSSTRGTVWLLAEKPFSGYLNHVIAVFGRLGYSVSVSRPSHWDVMWSHTYPMSKQANVIASLSSNQLVNHFPAIGYVANKASLGALNLTVWPKSFKLNSDSLKTSFISYAKAHPKLRWVHKSNNHRGVEVAHPSSFSLSQLDSGAFMQQFIHNPLLVDERKFDIGMYVAVTSMHPLRVYVYQDYLFRFCSEPYHPFDPSRIAKYVVTDDYKHITTMPSLKEGTSQAGLTFKSIVYAFLTSKGYDTEKLDRVMRDAITETFVKANAKIYASLKGYASSRSFFELVRFDFILDDEANVFLMEVNMSPNLSSEHFALNAPLYESVLFSLFSLVGIASRTPGRSKDDASTRTMQVSNMDLSVTDPSNTLNETCDATYCAQSCFHSTRCHMCSWCMNEELQSTLSDFFLEHERAHHFERIWPPRYSGMKEAFSADTSLINSSHQFTSPPFTDLTSIDAAQYLWTRSKCAVDVRWCS